MRVGPNWLISPSSAARAAVKAAASGTVKMTMFVSTVAGARSTPGSAARPAARGLARAGSPGGVIERGDPAGGHDARLAHGPAEHLLPAPGLLDERRRAGQAGAHRGPE